MRKVKVSVIIPNYNHAQFLEQRLDSIFNQTYQDYEVILLDDASTDRSTEILKKYKTYPKVAHVVFNKTNSGSPFKQWNKGIDLAKGEFIWIAESDDFCKNNFLEVAIKPLLDNPEIVLSYVQSDSVDGQGNFLSNWITYTDDLDSKLFLQNFVLDGNDFIDKFLVFKNIIPNASGVLIRRRNAIEVGKLNEDLQLRTTGDWHFYFKLILNKKIAFNASSLNAFRQHKKSVIAIQTASQSRLNVVNVLLQLRFCLKQVLKTKTEKIILGISEKNKIQIHKLEYEKAMLLINEKKYFKGFCQLFRITNLLFKYPDFRKDLFKRIGVVNL